MEPLSSTLCALAGFVAFALFIAFLVSMSRQETRERESAWRSFAAQHGFTYTPASGPWHAPKYARIDGRVGAASFTIDSVVTGGRASTTYTRLVTQAMQPLPLDAMVYRESALGALGDLLGAQDVVIGDAAFDHACVVKATREDLVRLWINAPLRVTIMQFCLGPHSRDAVLSYRQGNLELRWINYEKSPEVLHNAVSLAVEASSPRSVAQRIFQ